MAHTSSRSAHGPTEEQFLQLIDSTTLRRIKFPKEFYNKYVETKHRGEFVSLLSPLLSQPCEVKREGLYLRAGWKRFAELHKLEVGGYLHFTHLGNFVFYVTVFTEDGNRILYEDDEINQVCGQAATILTQKRKSVYNTKEAGSSSRSKGKAGVVIKDSGTILTQERKSVYNTKEAGSSSRSKRKAGVVIKDSENLSFGTKKTKKETTEIPVERDCFWLSVTQANLNSNSVYIPMEFARQNGLYGRKLGFLGLVNTENNVWCCDLTLCIDKRLKISLGWESFCRRNNIVPGDCCLFKLQPETCDIMVELICVSKEGKKSSGKFVQSSKVKEEQCILVEDDGPEEDVDATMMNMEAMFSPFAGKSTTEKGEASRK